MQTDHSPEVDTIPNAGFLCHVAAMVLLSAGYSLDSHQR